MYQPQTPYTRIAFETIKHYLDKGDLPELDFDWIPGELFGIRRGCFVSLHRVHDDELRGCIGTLEPHEKNLAFEIRRNAYSAAFHDHRFNPLEPEEFQHITISVDVLTEPEKVTSSDDLDPHIFGLIITDGNYQRGVLLPSIPGVDTVERQIQIVKRKAGLDHADERTLQYYRFTSNRYH